MEIFVFKTNLTDPARISEVESSLDVHPGVLRWNVDLEDQDNILRIVGNNMNASEVELILSKAGYYCEELE